MQSYLGKRGDSYDRFLIRIREMYESVNIVFQVLSNLTNNRIVLLGGINFRTLRRTRICKHVGIAAISWIKKNGPSINTGPF